MRKKIKSKLDQFDETLEAMEMRGKTCTEMVTWLRDEGVTVSEPTVSRFLESRRNARLQEKLLGSITSGSRQASAVEKQFTRNPAPELESLIKLLRVAILNMATQAQAHPELLKLVDQLTRTVMEFVSGQTKAMHKERELAVAEEKLELLKKKADQADQAKGIIGNNELSEAEKTERMRELFGR